MSTPREQPQEWDWRWSKTNSKWIIYDKKNPSTVLLNQNLASSLGLRPMPEHPPASVNVQRTGVFKAAINATAKQVLLCLFQIHIPHLHVVCIDSSVV